MENTESPLRGRRLGFGAGGLWATDALGDDEARRVVDAALEAGVRYFDTGPSYGHGRAEARLADALRGSDDVLVSTKVGTVVDAGGGTSKDYSADGMRRSLESSLRRLRRDHVDLLFVHGPLVPAQLTDEVLEVMTGFRDGGLARAIGASCDGEVADAVVAASVFDALMTTVNVVAPEGTGPARRAKDAGMTVVAKSPLAHAAFELTALLPRDRRRAWYLARLLRHYPRRLFRGLRLGPTLRAVSDDPPAATALRYVLSQPYVDAAVVGTTRPHHVRDLAAAAERGPLPPASLAAIDRRQARGRT
jgi:aryl-alcohol dehydrogenase-like predicted oxidoreductase